MTAAPTSAAPRRWSTAAALRTALLFALLLSLASRTLAASGSISPPLTTSASTASTASASADGGGGGGGGKSRRRKLVIGVDGGTESIRACAFDAMTGRAEGKPCAVPYVTSHPHPGWAEQDPEDWWRCLGEAVRGALASLGAPPEEEGHERDEAAATAASADDVCAICVDTTCCSVVALDSNHEPLRPCLLWMDARSAPQSREILERCRGDPALRVNCDGEGPISAEWMTPKSLWIKQNEPGVWDKAETICEYQDYVNYRLTGRMVASSCNAASRWHWDGEECLKDPTPEDPHPGRPLGLYEKLGIPELADKLPRTCLSMGSLIGDGLTAEAARHLGLPEGLPVAQGGPDAFVGMIGLGCIHPGQLCLITGSSHLHCVVTSHPTTAPGTWGAYRGAPLPGVNFAEGGQSSTGSIIRWAKNLFGGGDSALDYKTLDEEAAAIPPGAEGLVALETYQGSRTPVTDPLARGAIAGLTLSHTRAHIWRAKMEAVCFGTRACINGLTQAGHPCSEIVIAGGATRSPLWLQMHADVTGKPVVLCENADAPLLGCAVLASVGAGLHGTVEEAVKKMVRTVRLIEPRPDVADAYGSLYDNVYSKLPEAMRPVVHAIAALRGGGRGAGKKEEGESSLAAAAAAFRVLCGGGNGDGDVPGAGRRPATVISPSLLASDWSNIRAEIDRCVDADCTWIHVDVFDGVFLDSPHALTFGPQMVKAIRDYSRASGKGVVLDIHLCVDRPARYVDAMAEAGADRFIFQWEAMTGPGARLDGAMALAKDARDAGMKCGISINPTTQVEDILPLCESGLIDLVDVLAVEPGFGGQPFQESALSKLQELRKWREGRKGGPYVNLLVDGGINENTAPRAIEAGADILVAGTFLFSHKVSFEDGVRELLASNI